MSENTKERKLLKRIQENKFNWFGHMLERNCLIVNITNEKMEKSRKRASIILREKISYRVK